MGFSETTENLCACIILGAPHLPQEEVYDFIRIYIYIHTSALFDHNVADTSLENNAKAHFFQHNASTVRFRGCKRERGGIDRVGRARRR